MNAHILAVLFGEKANADDVLGSIAEVTKCYSVEVVSLEEGNSNSVKPFSITLLICVKHRIQWVLAIVEPLFFT